MKFHQFQHAFFFIIWTFSPLITVKLRISMCTRFLLAIVFIFWEHCWCRYESCIIYNTLRAMSTTSPFLPHKVMYHIALAKCYPTLMWYITLCGRKREVVDTALTHTALQPGGSFQGRLGFVVLVFKKIPVVGTTGISISNLFSWGLVRHNLIWLSIMYLYQHIHLCT